MQTEHVRGACDKFATELESSGEMLSKKERTDRGVRTDHGACWGETGEKAARASADAEVDSLFISVLRVRARLEVALLEEFLANVCSCCKWGESCGYVELVLLAIAGLMARADM